MRRSFVNLIIGAAYIGILLILVMTVTFAGAASQQIISGKVKDVSTVNGRLSLETSKDASKDMILSPTPIQDVKQDVLTALN